MLRCADTDRDNFLDQVNVMQAARSLCAPERNYRKTSPEELCSSLAVASTKK